MPKLSLNQLLERMAQAHNPVRVTNGQTAMTTANTEYSLVSVDRSRKVSLRMRDRTVAWWWNSATGLVTNGNVGMQMGAGDVLTLDGPMSAAVTLYFACATSLMTMDWSYELPEDN